LLKPKPTVTPAPIKVYFPKFPKSLTPTLGIMAL